MVETLMVIGLLIVLFITNYKIAISAIIIFLTLFSIYYYLTKILSYRWAHKRLKISKLSSLFLSESLKFVKDISLFNKQNYFLNNFSENEKKIFNLATKFSTFNLTPRVIIELCIITTLVIYLFYILNSYQDLSIVVANIGFYFIIALRFYPACSKILNGLNQIRDASPSIDLLYNEINDGNENLKKNDYNEISKLKSFNEIRCQNITYKYIDNEIIFENANLTINRNEKILLISPSGKGKSTFLDILAGLIEIEKGKIEYGDLNLSNNTNNIKNIIGYLSQQSFILNESLLFNITFENDIEKINHNLIKDVVKITQLNKIFSDGILNLNFQINENGSNLSGGQRQRIALSRILYKNPEVLILDEPTNEIDNLSEIEIIKSINNFFSKKNYYCYFTQYFIIKIF